MADYSATQFGGGFMPNSQDGGDGAGASPGQKKTYNNNQTLRAVTVKQLYDGTVNTPDDQFRVDGVDLDNITVVGKIVSLQEQSTNLTLILDDGTGRIELKYWIDADETEAMQQRKAAWKAGVYARVHGHLRTFSGEKSIIAFNIRPIEDFNEVTYHGLQAIFQHLHITRGGAVSPPEGAKAEAPSPMQAGFNAGGGVNGGAGMAASGAGIMAQDPNGMKPIQSAVNDVLNQPDALNNTNGLSLQEISNRLGTRYALPAIKDAAEWLSNEGHAYQGIDENHFKSTAC